MSTVEITAQNMEEIVFTSGITLLDFWAEWCGPCRNFGPIFEAASERHPEVTFGKVDTEAEQALAMGADISSIPTLIAFRDGLPLFRHSGALDGDALDELITEIQKLDMDEVRAQIEADETAEEEPYDK